MIPINAKVSGVQGTPPMIHFAVRGGERPIPPVPYTAQSLIEMPAHVARDAINKAECGYMTKNYCLGVEEAIRLSGEDVAPGMIRCTRVANEVAEWEFFLRGEVYPLSATTDLEGNIITIDA